MDSDQAGKIAGRVRQSRRARDWTQAQLAAAAGVAPGTVNSIENLRPVRPGNLRAVLNVLGLSAVASPEPEDGGVQLAIDIVRHWLTAMGEADRAPAIDALTRFTVLGDWRS